jgi:hypothetical protein
MSKADSPSSLNTILKLSASQQPSPRDILTICMYTTSFSEGGIASALLQGVEQELVSRGLDRIFTEASISARAFFEQTQCWFLVNLAPRGELLSVLSATRKLTMLRRFPVSPSSSDGVPYCCGSSISLGQSAMSGFIAGIRYTPSLWIAAPFCTQSAR